MEEDIHSRNTSDQVANACAEQRAAWEHGVPREVEHFLARYPSLAQAPDHLLDLIYNEICLRQDAGQTIAQQEYAERFPELARQLADLIEVHSALNGCHPSHGNPAHSENSADAIQLQTGPSPGGDDQDTPEGETMVSSPAVGAGQADASQGFDRFRNSATGLPTGQQFGDYDLINVAAEGGMGIVFKARQRSLNRIVALKMIRSGHFASAQEIERFQSEARAAAGLRHPNIVTVHEVNEVAGRYYFSMDYVEGQTLGQRINGRPLPARQAAHYLLTIAEAVQYAHDHQVLHRDLKPSNILFDKRDEPHVADFGVAKRFDGDLEAQHTSSLQTQTIVGTPSYMPPEQANRQLGATSPASDVYSLGAVLYEAVTGRPPFCAATPLETMLQVLHQEPASPRLINPSVPRDLDTICLKCLEKDQRRRYPSARALANDLRRFLYDEPITARRTSAIERMWRKCRKRPSTAILAAITAALAVFLLIASPLSTLRERALRREADQRRLAVEQQLRVSRAHQLVASAQTELLERPQLALLLGMEAIHATRQFQDPAVPAADQFLRSALRQIGGQPAPGVSKPMRLIKFSPNGKFLIAIAEGEHDIHVWTVKSPARLEGPQRLLAHQHEIADLAFAPSGNEFTSVDWHGNVVRWEQQQHGFAPVQKTSLETALYTVQYSANGAWIAAAGRGEAAWLWPADQNLATKKPWPLLGHDQRVSQLVFSANDHFLATAGMNGEIHLWQLNGESPAEIDLPDHRLGNLQRLAFSASGNYLAATGDASKTNHSNDPPSTLRVWQLSETATQQAADISAKLVLQLPAKGFAFRNPDDRLATIGNDGSLQLWDLPSGAGAASVDLGQWDQGLEQLEFSPDGNWLLAVTGLREGRQIALFWFASERIVEIPPIPSAGVALRASFSPDSRKLIVSDYGRTILMWDLIPHRTNWSDPQALRGHDGNIDEIVFDPAGRFLASACRDSDIRLWNLAAPLENDAWKVLGSSTHPILFARHRAGSADLVLCDAAGMLATVGPHAPPQEVWSEVDGKAQVLHVTANGQRLLTGDSLGRVQLWTFRPNGRLRFIAQSAVSSGEGAVLKIASSANGDWVAAVDGQQQARLWRVTAQTLEPVELPTADNLLVAAVDISPAADALVAACKDGQVRVWKLGSNGAATPEVALQFTHPAIAADFAASGRWLVAADQEGIVHLKQRPLSPPSETVVLQAETEPAVARALSEDGSRLATADQQGRIRIWALDQLTGVPQVAEILNSPGSVEQLALNRDGSRLMVASVNRAVRVWEIAPAIRGPVLLYKSPSGVRQLGFVEQSQCAYIVGWNGELQLLSLDTERLLSVARGIVGRDFTAAERQELLTDFPLDRAHLD